MRRASVVIVYDARRAERTTDGVLGARDIRMHVLSNGMTFDPGK